MAREDLAAGISGAYGRPLDEVVDVPLTGEPAQVAEKLAAYHAAGARHAVIGLSGDDWRAQVDLLAKARALLR